MLTVKHVRLKLISPTRTGVRTNKSSPYPASSFLHGEDRTSPITDVALPHFPHPCTKTCLPRRQTWRLYNSVLKKHLEIFSLTEPEMLLLPESFSMKTLNEVVSQQNYQWLSWLIPCLQLDLQFITRRGVRSGTNANRRESKKLF